MFSRLNKNQSYNKSLKELHSESYKIILNAISEDERTKGKFVIR